MLDDPLTLLEKYIFVFALNGRPWRKMLFQHLPADEQCHANQQNIDFLV